MSKPLAPFESSIAERYHEETKYSEDSLRREASRHAPLDFKRQPVPFKELPGRRILLPSDGLPIERKSGEEMHVDPAAEAGTLDVGRLARVLWFTNGCTRVVGGAGALHHFRAAPSAGGMYPTEMYVAVRDVPGLEPGIYGYQLLDHSLVLVRSGDPTDALVQACFGHPAPQSAQATILLTAVWYRSSWRYRERAYRRALLDTGHVLGNLCVAAPEEGLACLPFAGFRDELIESMLDVDPVIEGALVVAPLVSPASADEMPRAPVRESPTVEWRRALTRVQDRVAPEAPERMIAALHLAARMDDEARPVSPASQPPSESSDALVIEADVLPTSWDERTPITSTIAIRRSTRAFANEPLPRDALMRALTFALGGGQREQFVPDLLHTFVVALDVVGLPPGCYRVDSDPLRLVELSRGPLGRAMFHLGLGQQIFVHAGAVVVHTADLTRAVQRYGDRVYRSLNLDAGHIGERLDLATLHEGMGASGCGGYYDDEMNRALAIPENQAVIYITSLGIPAPVA